MRGMKMAATAAGALFLLGAGVGTAAAATGTHPDTLSPAATYSFACTLPQGAVANYSYSDGITSTTIYYNNHCQTDLEVRVHVGSSSSCWDTPRGKSSKVFEAGVTGLTEGC